MGLFDLAMLAILQNSTGSHTMRSAAAFLGGSLFRIIFIAVALALLVVVLTRRRS